MADVQKFTELNLIAPLLRALAEERYEIPTPIQARAIPPLLEGRDLLGCAQTGTGKTAAFVLPVLQRMHEAGRQGRHIRVLVLTPTRELAAQIGESFQTYGRHLPMTSTVIFGGVGQGGQERAIQRKPDILVATPGRLLDLMGQGLISLGSLEYFILDEADRMLDMGFIHDVRRVMAVLPKKRQSLFFSATMPQAVKELSDSLLTDPVRIYVAPKTTTAVRIGQTLMYVSNGDKPRLLETLLRDTEIRRALVFARTKHGADRICKQLREMNVAAGAIHGNRSQNARTAALEGFRQGQLRVLVATDIASRGIDVDDITHVINYDLPNEPESYIHRIGRTARAGRDGKAISFCSGSELEYLRSIEQIIAQKVHVDRDHDFHCEEASRGLENGVPAEPPCKRQARMQMERSQQRRSGGSTATARRPQRQQQRQQQSQSQSQPQHASSARPKQQSRSTQTAARSRRRRRR